jgi:hydroxyacylglutathione hydrolase
MRLTIEQVEQARDEGCVLVDIRKSTSFGAAFLHGAINIGLTPSSADWLKMVCEHDKELVLISDYEAEVAAAVDQFKGAGFEKIRGFLDGGVHAWASAGKQLDHLPQLSAHSVRHVLDKYADHILLDVRTDDEWKMGHVDGALHLPVAKLVSGGLAALAKDVDGGDIDKQRHITAMCGSGYRSNIAGSFLKSQGFEYVYSLLGGMGAWKTSQG